MRAGRGNAVSSTGARARRLGSSPLGYIPAMIVIGLVLLLLGFLLSIPLLWTLGIIVLIVGLVLLVLGSMNRSVGGRRHYW